MINISHPRIQSKPPVKNRFTARHPEDTDRCRKQIMAIVDTKGSVLCSKTNQVDNDDSTVGQLDEHADVKSKGNEKYEDYNQNVIESTHCSLEQLCSMINDLEKNVVTKGPKIDDLQLEPERDFSTNCETKGELTGTTYDDIMSFLENLEQEETRTRIPEVDDAILNEIFGNITSKTNVNYDSCNKIESHVQLTFREDLATANLHIEEKNAAIVLLKDQLKTERKAACEKLDAQRKSNVTKLQAQEEKYKGIVKRHQKFIEQLISEKTDLTEKCNSLAQRIKEMEIKAQRDMKAAADRHAVELQRAKEHYAAAEKIRRERWIEARTLKIKEMTVKGLEPELRTMVEQHEEEMQKLRNAHAKELQDSELRIVRRSNQQLEQLRLELTTIHERTLTNEKNILWGRCKTIIEEAETQFKVQRIKLLEDLKNEKLKLSEEFAKRDAENNAILQRTNAQHQEEMEMLKQQQANDKKILLESLQVEWEAWLANYKGQQITKFEKAENKIRDECNRERDRQIELAIGRLEKDSRDTKITLQQNFDGQLRSLKQKYESELQAAIDNGNMQKDKLTQTTSKLERTESQLQKMNSKSQEYMSELNIAKETVQRLTTERDDARKFARHEIETEKRELEEKISLLYREITESNANRESTMAQLHSRVKLIVTQKILAIRNLTKELDQVRSKCEHLEKLLDQQRREYILKSL